MEVGIGGYAAQHPSRYYLYGIAKHASGNQHEIVNCSAHLCIASGGPTVGKCGLQVVMLYNRGEKK